jgi:tripeptidyl-peptidase-1
MRLSICATVSTLLFLVQSIAIPNPGSNLVLHEKRHAPPTRWIKRDRIPRSAILPVRIGLTQNNLEKGHDFLMDV